MISQRMIGRQLRYVLNQDLTLRLYVGIDGNNEDAIEEMSGGGYAPRVFTLGNWTFDVPHIATSDVHEFRFDGSKRATVIGAYLTARDGGVYWVEPMRPVPIEVGRKGDVLPVRATYSLAPLS